MATGGSASGGGGGDAQPPQQQQTQRVSIPDVYAPRVFRGDDDDPEEWLSHFRRYVGCRGLTLDEQKLFFPLFLKGSALYWYDNLPDETKASIAGVLEAFNKYYVTDGTTERVLEQDWVFNRAQRHGERTRDYIGEMQRLQKRLTGVSDETLRHVILRGLLPHIKRHVLQQQCNTLDDILKAARVAELTADDEDSTGLAAEVRRLSSKIDAMSVNNVATPPRRSPTPERRSPSTMRTASRQVSFNQSSSSAPRRREWARSWGPPAATSSPQTTTTQTRQSVCFRCYQEPLG